MKESMNARRDGFALALTIIVIAGLAVLAAGAMMVGMNSSLIRQYIIVQDEMAQGADAGIELARARLNSNRALYPDSGFIALEVDSAVRGPGNIAVPNALRSTYAGPIGITSGQFGVNGAIVSVVRSGPNTIVRRGSVVQESFARFAYFTDVEPSGIVFGGGDFITGPVHSNDDITIHSTGATFDGPVTTSGDVNNAGNAVFRRGYTEDAPPIPLPALADLQKLRTQATAGRLALTATSGNSTGRASMRIEFVAIDLNSDGDDTDENEGFIRVYQSSNRDWVVGANPVGNLRNSRNCGHRDSGLFKSADAHGSSGSDNWIAAVSNSGKVCYLGGAPEITNGWVASNSDGAWLAYGGTVSPLLSTRTDRNYLFPLSRSLNDGFRGVIYVEGDVAVSGTVRSRVTLATTGNIVIADDIEYSLDPSVGNCQDILGLFAGGSVVVAETPINSAWQRGSGSSWHSYDDSESERIHAFVLTLNTFTVEDFDEGPTNAEDCEGTNWGRGCLYLTGGIIQRQRGAVGQSDGHGYLKRYSYDQCGETQPPPYFPTTGRFSRGAYFEIDPTGFDITAYFASLTAGS
jgi:hypothetical protein